MIAAGGPVIERVGTHTDIDRQRRVAQEFAPSQRDLTETAALLDTPLSSALIGFGFVDRDSRIVRLDDTVTRVNGRTVDAQVGPVACWCRSRGRPSGVAGDGFEPS